MDGENSKSTMSDTGSFFPQQANEQLPKVANSIASVKPALRELSATAPSGDSSLETQTDDGRPSPDVSELSPSVSQPAPNVPQPAVCAEPVPTTRRKRRRSQSQDSTRDSDASNRRSESENSQPVSPLTKFIDWGFAAVIILSPFFMGGRHPIGRLALVVLTWGTIALWAASQCMQKKAFFRRLGVEWLLVLGGAFVFLQLVPLPAAVLRLATPTVARDLPLWTTETDSPVFMGNWQTISMNPYETKGALVIYLTYVGLFVVLVQRMNTFEDVQHFMRLVAISATAMAGVGLLQYMMGNGKFLWMYEHPTRTTFGAVKGAFVNANHFAHFLALAIGPLVWWICSRNHSKDDKRTDRARHAKFNFRHGLLGMLGLVLLAGLLSYSRGGIAAIGLASVVCMVLLWRARALDKKLLIGLGVACAILVLAFSLHGMTSLQKEVTSIAEAESLSDLSAARSMLWGALARAIPAYWRVGTGVGTHRFIYRTYFDGYANVQFTHAENGYLQLMLETGFVGFALFAIGAFVSLKWATNVYRFAKRRSMVLCSIAIVVSLVTSLAHSFGDFVWYISACMMLTIVLIACARRLDQLSREEADVDVSFTRTRWLATFAVLLAVGGMCTLNRIGPALGSPHWDSYLKLSIASNDYEHLESERRANSIDAPNPIQSETVSLMLSQLDRALENDPSNPVLHHRKAGLLLRMFEIQQLESENVMALSQVRDAAMGAGFESAQEQDQWLDVAVGDNMKYLRDSLRHSLTGLRGCPMDGSGYLFMAELTFLLTPDPEGKRDFVEQALRVRPYEGSVLFAAGKEAALDSDVERALNYWKNAFQRDPRQRKFIVGMLGLSATGEEMVAQFEPDIEGTHVLFNFYRKAQLDESVKQVGAHYLPMLAEKAKASESREAIKNWRRASWVADEMGSPEASIDYAKKAVEVDVNNYESRRQLAFKFYKSQRWSEAAEHLHWCIRRQPDDSEVTSRLTTARKQESRYRSR
jgi:O-antigen ligase/tetratricopeptide (TPR) repeat protein